MAIELERQNDSRLGGIARAPTLLERIGDRAFRGLCFGLAWLAALLVVLIVWEIGGKALPAIRSQGLEFLTTSRWDPGKGHFGILAEIGGTLYSSLLAVALATVLGVTVAILLTQDFLPPVLEELLKDTVELLAAIPSVVYGLWGIFELIPVIRPPANWLHEHVGWIPIFSTRLTGPGLLPAALVLAIMVLPTITAISRDALAAVPPKIREAAFGLGATKWEAIFGVILPTASRGIYGAIILGLGRALGETMALAMLIGSSSEIHWSLFALSNTLAALLATKFSEASPLEIQALMYSALVLLAITLLVNILGTLVIMRTNKFSSQGVK
jgi:phosphate transport system permease protein